jgi:hypothetical protein
VDVGKDFREAFLESFWGEPQAMLMYVRTCWEMYFWGGGMAGFSEGFSQGNQRGYVLRMTSGKFVVERFLGKHLLC